ncbi:MAG: PAS domain-containing protein [Actinomycetota bacterium]
MLGIPGDEFSETIEFFEMLDALPVPIFFKAGDGSYLAVNQAFEAFSGRVRQQILGRPIEELYPPEQAAMFKAADAALLAEGGVQRYETVIDSYGDPREVLVHKSTLTYAGGTSVGIVGSFIDVSTRKRAEAMLADEQRLLEQILHVLPASLVWTDRDLTIGGCNRVFADNFPHLDSPVGERLDELASWTKTDEQLAAVREVLDTGQARLGDRFQVEGLGVRPTRTLESHRVPLRDGSDEVIGLLSLSFDVTGRVAMETKLATASRLESMGQLAAGVAHEINTPAQFVRDNVKFVGEGIADLLAIVEAGQAVADAARTGGDVDAALAAHATAVADGDLEFLVEELPGAIDQSMEGVERISHIVRAMKDTAHPGRDVNEPVDLNRLIDSTVVVARNEWKYVADLGLDFDDDLPEVLCRASQISQVILNLVVNASHAIGDVISGADKGRIDITTRADGDHAVITVHDTGAGIPVEVRDRIFDPFFTTKGVGQGTGQGLSLAYSVIVKAHGGELWFDTEPGRGTTFTIRLPVDGGGMAGPPRR